MHARRRDRAGDRTGRAVDAVISSGVVTREISAGARPPPASPRPSSADSRARADGPASLLDEGRPAWINPQAQAELLSPQDPRYTEVLDYLRYLTDYYSLNAVFKTDGDEIVVQ